MLHANRACPVRRAIALLTLLFVATAVHAQSVSTPTRVSALIYSSSAAELFWTPPAGSLVEVTRNGSDLMLIRKNSRHQTCVFILIQIVVGHSLNRHQLRNKNQTRPLRTSPTRRDYLRRKQSVRSYTRKVPQNCSGLRKAIAL